MSLRERLEEPAERVALAALPGRWFVGRATLRCAGGGALAADPRAPNWLRGAVMAVLRASASPEAARGEPCPWSPPCLYDLLFRDQARLTPGLPVPKPYVLSLADADGDLVVGASLFGFASDWLEALAEALTAALSRGLGPGAEVRGAEGQGGKQGQGAGVRGAEVQGAGGQGSGRRGLAVIERRLETPRLDDPAGVAAAPDDPSGRGEAPWIGAAALTFASPLRLRRGAAEAGATRSLLSVLGNRVSGLARWQDCAPEADWRGLKRAAAALDWDETGLRPVVWTRGKRQGSALVSGRGSYGEVERAARDAQQVLPMTGLVGTLVLRGDLGPFLPLLAIGQTTHVGSHAALGLGRYDLELATGPTP